MLRGLTSLLALSLLAALPAMAKESDGTWIRGVFTGHSPRPIALPEAEAWREAAACAARTDDTFVLVGSGRSMQPLYAPGTLLVLQQVAYTSLRAGQTVLYRNRSNRAVAHVIVAKCRDGWRVRGLNNRTHDDEPVVADNLVGVVVAAYTPAPAPHAATAALARSDAPARPVLFAETRR